MSNRLPFYLWNRLGGERQHDRFGDLIVTAILMGMGLRSGLFPRAPQPILRMKMALIRFLIIIKARYMYFPMT